jgi:DNA-binding transcriptional ArsR family regulator
VTIPHQSDAQAEGPIRIDFGCLLADQDWLMRAARLSGRTLHLAVVLRLLAVRQHSSTVELSNAATSQFGLDRNAKYRTLSCLEDAGLVVVKRRRGRSPIVTLLQFDARRRNAP